MLFRSFIKTNTKARDSWKMGTNKISSFFPTKRGFQDVFDEISSLGRPAIEKGFRTNTKARGFLGKKELLKIVPQKGFDPTICERKSGLSYCISSEFDGSAPKHELVPRIQRFSVVGRRTIKKGFQGNTKARDFVGKQELSKLVPQIGFQPTIS